MKRPLKDHRPKAPYIPSQLVATRMAEKWDEVNDFSYIQDRSGQRWSCHIAEDTSYDDETRTAKKTYVLRVSVRLGREELVQSEVFNPSHEDDARILGMLEGRQVPIHMKEVRASCQELLDKKLSPTDVMEGKTRIKELGEAEAMITQEFYRLRDQMKRSTLRLVKRKLVVEWIENQKLFATEY